MEEKLIKDIYELAELEDVGDTLVTWYNSLINKAPESVSAFDINRMIRQNVLPELALERAMVELSNNPFVGDSTNGDVLEHVLSLGDDLIFTKSNEFKLIIKKAENNLNNVAWWFPEEKDEYKEMLARLKKIIK